jgi:hypothetical protein
VIDSNPILVTGTEREEGRDDEGNAYVVNKLPRRKSSYTIPTVDLTLVEEAATLTDDDD